MYLRLPNEYACIWSVLESALAVLRMYSKVYKCIVVSEPTWTTLSTTSSSSKQQQYQQQQQQQQQHKQQVYPPTVDVLSLHQFKHVIILRVNQRLIFY